MALGRILKSVFTLLSNIKAYQIYDYLIQSNNGSVILQIGLDSKVKQKDEVWVCLVFTFENRLYSKL